MNNLSVFKRIVENAQDSSPELALYGDIQVIIKDRLTQGVNLRKVLRTVEQRVPSIFAKELDIIYVGDFPQLTVRNVESVYMNGAIFLSNNITDDTVLAKSIIHELAHNVESVYAEDIYGDGTILAEFLNKRERLRALLEGQKLFCDVRLYSQADYSKTFDDFLYKTVGYDRLAQLCSSLFISPYGATSIREYFANGFEHYYTQEDQKRIFTISPRLCNKIKKLSFQEE